jgi:hypothetical protein
MSRFSNRRWLVIPTSITSSINFNEVLEHSADSLRLSLNGSETFVKYEVNEVTKSYDEQVTDPEDGTISNTTVAKGIYGRPSFYTGSYTEYKHEDILTLLSTEDWVDSSSH